MTSVTVDTSITFGDLIQIGQSGPAMNLNDYFVAGTQYFTINFDDVLKNGSGTTISGYYDEFSIRGADDTIYYSIAISGGVFHNKNNTGETLSNSTIFKVNNAPIVTEIKLSWVPPYHPYGLDYLWHGNTTITFWKMLSSVPTSDISAHPTMFEIDMRSSVPSDSHQDYITNDSVTHNDAEQAGDFTTDVGLTTNLDNLFLDDNPNAITVICKFKNDTDTTNGVLFHIGNTNGDNRAFGIDIQSTVVYLYTWNDDNKYETSVLNLGTQWNEMIAIFDESKTDPDRLILYLNGVKQTALNEITLNGTTHNYASSPTIDLSTNKNLYVGQRHNSVYWSGYMKHIQIFPKVVYGLIKIKVKLTLKPINMFNPYSNSPEDSFSYNAENYPSVLSDMTTFLQGVYFKYELKDDVTLSNSIGMFVDFKINGNSTNPADNVQYNAYRYFSTSGEGQGTIYNDQNSIENNNFKIRIGGLSNNYDKNKTYAILTFHRELIESDITNSSSGDTFEARFKRNLYHRHIFETPYANSTKTTFVFEEFNLSTHVSDLRFDDRVILKYKNTSGQDTWVQFGYNMNTEKINYITYDDEDDAYTITNVSDTIVLSGNTYSINVDDDDRNIEMIFLTGQSYNTSYTDSYAQKLKVVQYNNDTFSQDPPSITPDVENLTNIIHLSNFVSNSNIYDWSEYKIKFTYDGNEQPFDIDPDTTTFTLNMLLKQLEVDVTCRFDILKETDDSVDSVVHTSNNFTLVKQTLNTSAFELSLLSSAVTNSILFKNDSDSQWIYMHESDSLNSANILYSKYIVESKVNYNVYFVDGTGQSSQSLTNDDKQKITLKVELSKSGDTISLTDTTEFIIHKVNFSDFHTPTINPISNINYFKEKTFRFTVSDNKYSFTFEGNTYEKTFKSGTYSMTNINNRYNIIINNPADDNFEEALDIMPYKFIDGPNTLTFKIVNTLSGVQNIYTTSIFEKSTSKSISIDLNVESDAIISCIPS